MKFLFTLLICVSICQADMGSIPAKKGTKISEPTQDAIIAWNGREQILYLQTKLASSEATAVLEVMPLPARPMVEASSSGVFKRTRFLAPHPPAQKSNSGDPFGDSEPGGRVVESKQIGAHAVKIVELLDTDAFSRWVEEEFLSGYPDSEIPPALLAVIGEYVADGYTWFLFDRVDLTAAPAKKIPLRIRFATGVLYYPMRITRTEKGKTTVSLFVLTDQLFDPENMIGIPRKEVKVLGKPREIAPDKLHWIDAPLGKFFSGQPAKLRQWRITGQIDGFLQDVLVKKSGR